MTSVLPGDGDSESEEEMSGEISETTTTEKCACAIRELRPQEESHDQDFLTSSVCGGDGHGTVPSLKSVNEFETELLELKRRRSRNS